MDLLRELFDRQKVLLDHFFQSIDLPQAQKMFEESWEKDTKIRAYMNGVHDLFEKLRIADVSGSASDHIPMTAMNSEICMVCNKKREEHFR